MRGSCFILNKGKEAAEGGALASPILPNSSFFLISMPTVNESVP